MADDPDEAVRLAVYNGLVTSGRPPSPVEMAASLAMRPEDVQRSLHRLHASRDVVLDDRGEIVMAHPFATIPLGFSVMGHDTLWWGGCAWDSFALPQLCPVDPGAFSDPFCGETTN